MKLMDKSKFDLMQMPFIREELQIVKMITHNNIVEMKEIFESQDEIRIVMEQVNEGELFEHINTYEMEEKEVALIMYQLIDVIYYLQCSGIVHRDLKTENILIKKDTKDEINQIKVTDFGLSKIIGPNAQIDKREFCGTPAYVSPELCSRKNYGKEVDMWSAGVIFYILICRSLPFHGFDRKSTLKMIMEK